MGNRKITFSVAECTEFHSLGEYHEGIETIEEAVRLYKRIPPKRLNGMPGISIVVEDEGEASIVYGKFIDMSCLKYLPCLQNDETVKDTFKYLIGEFPKMVVMK